MTLFTRLRLAFSIIQDKLIATYRTSIDIGAAFAVIWAVYAELCFAVVDFLRATGEDANSLRIEFVGVFALGACVGGGAFGAILRAVWGAFVGFSIIKSPNSTLNKKFTLPHLIKLQPLLTLLTLPRIIRALRTMVRAITTLLTIYKLASRAGKVLPYFFLALVCRTIKIHVILTFFA